MQVNTAMSDTDCVTMCSISQGIWEDRLMKKIWMLSDNPAFFIIKILSEFSAHESEGLSFSTHPFQYISVLTCSTLAILVMSLEQRLLTMSNCGSFVKWIAEDFDKAIEHILICDLSMN